jgi:hypothetical protein
MLDLTTLTAPLWYKNIIKFHLQNNKMLLMFNSKYRITEVRDITSRGQQDVVMKYGAIYPLKEASKS